MGNSESTIKEAVAVITPSLNTGDNKYNIKGFVLFTQKPGHVAIHIELSGLKKNAKHGFHIHDKGDL